MTKLYLSRLKRFDPLLKCVVTLTQSLALEQAAAADARWRPAISVVSPRRSLGAKDLIAYPGYPTTWGATPYKGRVIEGKATVATRLEEAGAVMLAKLSLGALAQGDLWFGGRHPQPMGPANRLERQLGRVGISGGGGLGRLCNRQRNARQHRVAVPRLRGDRTTSHIRPGKPPRLHDPGLDDG